MCRRLWSAPIPYVAVRGVGREPSCVRRVRPSCFWGSTGSKGLQCACLVEHRACLHVWGSPGRLPFGWSAASRGLGFVQTGLIDLSMMPHLAARVSSDHGSQCPPLNSAPRRRSAISTPARWDLLLAGRSRVAQVTSPSSQEALQRTGVVGRRAPPPGEVRGGAIPPWCVCLFCARFRMLVSRT